MEWIDEDDEETLLAEGEERTFQCPYCWEMTEPPLDDDLEGELVWDCSVCCRPWLIRISVDYEGHRSVVVERAQD